MLIVEGQELRAVLQAAIASTTLLPKVTFGVTSSDRHILARLRFQGKILGPGATADPTAPVDVEDIVFDLTEEPVEFEGEPGPSTIGPALGKVLDAAIAQLGGEANKDVFLFFRKTAWLDAQTLRVQFAAKRVEKA